MYQQTFSHNWEHIFIDANLEKLLVEKGSTYLSAKYYALWSESEEAQKSTL